MSAIQLPAIIQHTMAVTTTVNVEGPLWLGGYIAMNLFTTVLNKMLLTSGALPFPSAMSLWHYFCSAIGAVFMVRVLRVCEPAAVDLSTQIKFFFFSILFNINILVSTASLHLGGCLGS